MDSLLYQFPDPRVLRYPWPGRLFPHAFGETFVEVDDVFKCPLFESFLIFYADLGGAVKSPSPRWRPSLLPVPVPYLWHRELYGAVITLHVPAPVSVPPADAPFEPACRYQN